MSEERCERADSRISPGTKNFFLQKRLSHKGDPLYGQNHFWRGFCQRGHEQFSDSKTPPYRGSHLPHAHPSSFEMRRTVPVPIRGVGDGRKLISPEVAEPVG